MGSRIEKHAVTVDTSLRQRQEAPRATTPVVILRENDLDCDLTTAIQRVRSQDGMAGSRILVIAPDEVGEVGDVSEHEVGPTDVDVPAARATVFPTFPLSAAQTARRGELEALGSIGERLQPLLACLDLFLDESATGLDELIEGIPDRPRATLQSQVRTLREIVDWTRAVAEDLRHEVDAAAEGFRVVDLGALLVDAAAEVEATFPGIRVGIEPEARAARCHGRSADLAEGVFLGLRLVAERVGCVGAITVAADTGRDVVRVRLFGVGEVRRVDDDGLVDRFRKLIVDDHGGRIAPDLHGSAAAGIVIQLPLAGPRPS